VFILLQARGEERECADAERARGSFEMMGTQLFNAAADGNSTKIRTLLSRDTPGVQPFINYQNSNGFTPLHKAADKGHTFVTEQLLAGRCNIDLQTRASVDYKKKGGATPLMLASLNGHASVTKQLIAARCNIDLQDDYGYKS